MTYSSTSKSSENLLTRFLLIGLLAYILTNIKDGMANQSVENEVKYMLLQMSNVINTKDPRKITEFFNYYASPKATFIKKSVLINPTDNRSEEAREDIALTRDEYVKYLLSLLEPTSQYAMQAEVLSVEAALEEGYSISSVAINEVAVYKIKNKEDKDVYIKTSVITNCNYSLFTRSTHPLLTGSNCLEKIMIQ